MTAPDRIPLTDRLPEGPARGAFPFLSRSRSIRCVIGRGCQIFARCGGWSVVGVRSDDWDPWPLWLTLAWGLGIVFNAWDVYARRPITEAEVRREIDRLGHRA